MPYQATGFYIRIINLVSSNPAYIDVENRLLHGKTYYAQSGTDLRIIKNPRKGNAGDILQRKVPDY